MAEETKKKRGGRKTVSAHVLAAIDKRREIVASLARRKMRQSEILNQISMPVIVRMEDGVRKEYPNPTYMINPETGQPYDRATISRDIKALRKDWQAEAKVDSEEFFAEQLAEMREARRRMWAKDDMHGVTNNLMNEIKLTGTAKPEKVEVSVDESQFKQHVDMFKELFQSIRHMEQEVKKDADSDS